MRRVTGGAATTSTTTNEDEAGTARKEQGVTMDIMHEIDIASTPEKVYAALTTQEGLSGWYTPEARAKPEVGAFIEFKFSTLTDSQFRVEDLEPNRHVAWKGVQVPDEWKQTPITFDIRPDGDGVVLTFCQRGFPHDYEPFAGFSYCWAQYIRSLKLLLETGKGEPFESPASIACGTTPKACALIVNDMSFDMDAQTFTPDDSVSAIISKFGSDLGKRTGPFGLLVQFRVHIGVEAQEVREHFDKARPPTLQDPGCIAFEVSQHALDRRNVRFGRVVHPRGIDSQHRRDTVAVLLSHPQWVLADHQIPSHR
jgi:hypothetical protein